MKKNRAVRVKKMKKRVQFFKQDKDNPYTLDDNGQQIPNYIPAGEPRWCAGMDEVALYGQGEPVERDAKLAKKQVKLILRFTRAIDNTMLFDYEGRRYGVIACGDEAGDFKELTVIGEVFESGGRN